MSAYTPLSTDDRPIVPSLTELQAGIQSSHVPVETMNPMAPVDIETPAAVESQNQVTTATMIVSTPVVEQPDLGNQRCLVKSCCCGCSLATGVWWLSLIDVIGAVWTMLFVASIFVAKAHEKDIDGWIESSAEETSDTNAEGTDVTVDDAEASAEAAQNQEMADQAVKNVNMVIDVQTMLTPLYIILALLTLYFACKGFMAVKGDLAAARSYYKWRMALVFWALISGMTQASLFHMITQALLAFYFACVAKSHYMNLLKEQISEHPTAPATLVIVGEKA